MASNDVFEECHVLYTTADPLTGAIVAHIGDAVSGECTDDAAIVYQQPGFIALSAPPDAGVAGAECVAIKTNGHDIVIAQRDVRSAEICGLIKQGEACAYAPGSQACTLYKLDGSIIQYTTHDNTKQGRAVYQSVGPAGSDFCFPYGRHQFDKTGIHIHHVSGATLDMGSLTAPAPLDSFGSYFTATASMMRLKTSFISIGPDTGIPSPVARADALCEVLIATSTALSQVSAVLATLAAPAAYNCASPGSPAIANPVLTTAAGLAVSALGSAIAAITASLPGVVPAPVPIGSQALVTM